MGIVQRSPAMYSSLISSDQYCIAQNPQATKRRGVVGDAAVADGGAVGVGAGVVVVVVVGIVVAVVVGAVSWSASLGSVWPYWCARVKRRTVHLSSAGDET